MKLNRNILLTIIALFFFLCTPCMASVNISDVTVTPSAAPQTGVPLTVTVNASSADGSPVYYKFFYCANYGTSAYATTPWTVVQEYSTSNTAQYTFNQTGKYIIVVRAVTDPNNEPAALPIVGHVVDVGGTNDVTLTGLAKNPSAFSNVGETVQFTANAVTYLNDIIYYKFYYCANYGTAEHATTPWVVVQDYSTSNTCNFTFPTAGDYLVVVRAVTNPNSEPAALPIVGQVVRVVEQSSMARDVDNYVKMASSVMNLSPMLDEMGDLLNMIMEGDTSIVTANPAELDLNNLPSEITLTADFGNGYTPDNSTAVFTGRVVIHITGIVFSQTMISANAVLTATSVQRDGLLILDGVMSLAASAVPAGSNLAVSVNCTFSNLRSLDFTVNGKADVSIPSINIQDTSVSQPIMMTFDNFSAMGFQISGTAQLTQSGSIYDVLFNLTTNQGPVAGTVRFDSTTEDQTIISTPAANLTAGPYTLDINDVIMAPESCAGFSSGNIVVTGNSETKTIYYGSDCTYTIQ